MHATHDVDLIPGTEIIYTGRDGDSDSVKTLVLVPEPSNDPRDPLNWSKTWKTIVILNQFVFVFVSILTPLSIAPLTPILTQEFGLDLTQVNMLFGAAAISLGYANFITVPCANVFGRRIVMIVCGLVCVGANIWQANVTSYASFIGARVLSGLGAAANESLMPMVIEDLLFVHQRGRSMGLYFWAYFMGAFAGPIISGAAGASIGWRWFFWICAVLQGFSLLLILVAHPETKFERKRPRTPIEEASGSEPRGRALEKSPQALQSGSMPGSNTSAEDVGHFALNGRPDRTQFSILPRPFWHGGASVIRDIISPLQIFSYPIVLWAGCSMGFAANCTLALNLTQAPVFGAPPYLFTPAQIGYVNFAFIIGAIIALTTAGPLSDWIALRRARKNGGILEAEMRLPALIPYIFTLLVGLVVVGVGYQNSWSWPIVVIIGFGFTGTATLAISAISIAYAVTSYKALPGEIMIAATIIKNTFGFGMVFFFDQWATQDGYLKPMLMMMGVTVGFSLLGLLVFMPCGKAFRRMTRNSKLHAL